PDSAAEVNPEPGQIGRHSALLACLPERHLCSSPMEAVPAAPAQRITPTSATHRPSANYPRPPEEQTVPAQQPSGRVPSGVPLASGGRGDGTNPSPQDRFTVTRRANRVHGARYCPQNEEPRRRRDAATPTTDTNGTNRRCTQADAGAS